MDRVLAITAMTGPGLIAFARGMDGRPAGNGLNALPGHLSA